LTQGKADPGFGDTTWWPESEQARIDHLLQMRKEATELDLVGYPEVIKKAKKANFNFYRTLHAIYL
jgi:hypothetical protein